MSKKKNGTPLTEELPTLIDVLKKQVRPDSTEFLVIGEDRNSPGNFNYGVTNNLHSVAIMLIGFMQQLSPELQRHIIDNLPDAAPPKVKLALPPHLDS